MPPRRTRNTASAAAAAAAAAAVAGPSPAAAAEGESPGKAASTFQVTIKNWHAVATWTWNAGDDVCGICRMPFDGCPPDGKFPGDDSPVVWGVCGHAFHLQCITKWLTSQTEQRCPFCRRAWEYKAAQSIGRRRQA